MIPRSTPGERATGQRDVAMRRGTRRHHSSLATHTTVPRPVVVNHERRECVDRRLRAPTKRSFLPRRFATPCDDATMPFYTGSRCAAARPVSVSLLLPLSGGVFYGENRSRLILLNCATLTILLHFSPTYGKVYVLTDVNSVLSVFVSVENLSLKCET